MLLVNVLADLFKLKLVGSILVLTCWPKYEQVKWSRLLAQHNMIATFSCDPSVLYHMHRNLFQGILYFHTPNVSLTEPITREYFYHWYKWVIVGVDVPDFLRSVRYDADVVLIKARLQIAGATDYDDTGHLMSLPTSSNIILQDVLIHLSKEVTTHAWAMWTKEHGLQLTHDRERVLRRLDFEGYPIRIATPMGQFSEDSYEGSIMEYVLDLSNPERDSGIRCGYRASVLMIEALNGTDVLIPTILWGSEVNNSSMVVKLTEGTAELAGGILRILPDRISRLDYAMPIWPFRVGFTYLAERESSSNMFIEPFTASVWWTCLAIMIILAVAQRATSKLPEEKEGAFMAVLATYLQQDASAVPEGLSGRWTFVVLSVSSMLVHSYYTSAIVSALMSAGIRGPDSLRSLADSKYAIACEDYDYMRYLMFDVQTNWDDLEYLKKKKKTSGFYQVIERGVELIHSGSTAYHTEYNQLYPHLNTFSDDQVCKIQHVDTIPETMTWVTANKHGQFTNVFRSAGGWLTETGLAKRLVSRLRIRPPPCRAAMLAERVKFGDVAPVVVVSILGTVLSLILLAAEKAIAKWKKRRPTFEVQDDSANEV